MATQKKTTKSKSSSKPKSSTMSNAAKTVVRGSMIPGYTALSAAKKVDDYIQKKDPYLSKSKAYNAVKSPAKKVKGAMDYAADKVGSVAKGAFDIFTNPGKYIEKGAAKVGKYAAKGAKAIDDYVQKNDSNLSKSKVYGAIKGKAKEAVKSKVIEKGVGVIGKRIAMANPMLTGQIVGREVGKGAVAAGKFVKSKAKQGAKAVDDYIEKNDPYLSKSKAYGKVEGAAKAALGVKSASAPKKTSTVKSSTAKTSTAKPVTKTTTPVKTASKTTTTTTKAAPTVSELWKQKTGTSWSQAKNQGLTDGSVSSNTALMKKLQSGQITKKSLNEDTFKKNMERDVEDELSGKIKFDEPTKTARYGGSMKAKMKNGGSTKYQAGGMTNKIPTAKGARLNPTGRKTAMTALGIKGGMKKMKTGGMVNSNSKVSAIKSAGSKGVKTGANTRISASKIARGRVGGTSTAPRTAAPKAMYGMSMKPGMMKMGGTKKK